MLRKSNCGIGVKIGTAVLSFFGIFLVVRPAHAWSLEAASVINSYQGCSWRRNGDGTSTLSMVVNFKKGFGSRDNPTFGSRGFLVYTYDRSGTMKQSARDARSIRLDGLAHDYTYTGRGYTVYYRYNKSGSWREISPFSANVEVLIDDEKIVDWPAVSIQAANVVFPGNDVGEITGGAYFDLNNTSSGCKIIDPEKPPPPAIAISMTAPDWNLGELPEGNGEKIFPNSPDQLCFTYLGAAVSGKQFIINADSANGVAGSRYRLKNLKDASQLVPYNVTLDSGTSNVSLPNASNKSLPLNSSGRTCFVPTFKTTVDSTVKDGDYSDVLTFTVVTKS